MDDKKNSYINNIVIVCYIVFFVAILALAYQGLFVRYLADDYEYARIHLEKGIIGAQTHWYSSWVLRYAAVFTVSMIETAGGASIAHLLIPIVVVIWGIILVWVFVSFFRYKDWKIHWPSIILLAELVLVTQIQTSLNATQSFFWQAGRIAYTMPLIFFSLYVGVVLSQCALKKESVSKTVLFLAAGCTFIAGGFSDTFTLMQFVLLMGAAYLARFKNQKSGHKKLLNLLYLGLFGASISFAIVLFQPGNFKRIVLYSQPHNPVLPFISFFGISLYILVIQALTKGLFFLIAFFLTFLTAKNAQYGCSQSHKLRGTFTVFNLKLILLAFLPFLSTIGISVFAINQSPPLRALAVPNYIAVLVTVYAGYKFATSDCRQSKILTILVDKLTSRKKIVMMIVGICLIVGPINIATSILFDRYNFRSYAQAWDRRDRQILEKKRSGEQDIIINSLGFTYGLDDVESDPRYYINVAMSRLYKVHSIRAPK